MMSDGFLSRWSRLKRGEAREAVPEPVAPEATPAGAPDPVFDLSTLPDIETVTAETDFTLFLQKGVPEFLKRQALRRAWSLDPGIRDFVGPADYAWDFNAVDGVPGFSLTLGGDIKRLLAQAIGQLDEVAEAPPDFLPPGAIASHPVEAEEAPPEDPLRLAEALESAPLPAQEAVPAMECAPIRRHGGATPV